METTVLIGLTVAVIALIVVVGLAMIFPHTGSRPPLVGVDDDPAGRPVSASDGWPGFWYMPSADELEEARDVAQIYPTDLPPSKPSDVDTFVSSDDPEKLRQALINILSIGMQVVDRDGRPLTTDEIDRFISERFGRRAGEDGARQAAPSAPPSPSPEAEPRAAEQPRQGEGKYAERLSRLSQLKASMAESTAKN